MFRSSVKLLSNMTQKQAAPYGSWLSPISTSLVLSPTSISLVDVLVTPQNSLVWVEGRPNQAGRNAIVSQSLSTRAGGSKEEEVIGETKWNARTRVHEYGGASVALGGASQDSVIFSDMKGPLYRVQMEKNGEGWGKPEQITPGKSIRHRILRLPFLGSFVGIPLTALY